MTWNLGGQYLDVLLSGILIVRLCRLGLYSKYRAFVAFIVFDSVQSLLYIGDRYLSSQGYQIVDYRFLWCSLRVVGWLTTGWMVYALLTGILGRLPGILRFSLQLLNVVVVVALTLAIATVKPQYAASILVYGTDGMDRMTSLVIVLERAFSFAQLLTVFSILIFVLFFPIRVPRNLAVFSVGSSIYLSLQVGALLMHTYAPQFFPPGIDPVPYVMAVCLLYWISTIRAVGEHTEATLGRNWRSVPGVKLVQQLESLNSALLGSREHS